MNLAQLINNVPDADSLNSMSDWFSDVNNWAQKSNMIDIAHSAENGLFFCSDTKRVEEFRRKTLSLLRTVYKEKNTMPDVMRITNRVFLVHGHNESMRREVKEFLKERLGYDVCVLDEQPSKGRTIIQKLLDESATCDRAIVLYSPDDVLENGQRRARQNVIFEHGLLWSKFGAEKVIALADGDLEWPSDLSGVLYIPYRDNWQEGIRKEWGEVNLQGGNLL